MKLASTLTLMMLLSACGSDRSPQPVTEVHEMQARVAETVATPEEPVEEEPAEEACPHIVLADAIPLEVRSGPNDSTAKTGELENGTVAEVSETRNGWAHLSSPLEGWVKEASVYNACETPAVVPAIPLGQQTFVLVTEWREPQSQAGVALAEPDVEDAPMRFRRRDARPLDPPTPVTLVTKTGACVREAGRRIVMIAHCPDDDDQTMAVTALEVESCPQLTAASDDRPHMAAPLMVAVLGNHEGAVLADWTHADAPTTEPQRANVARYIQTEEEVPETMTRFGESEFGWISFEDRLWLMRGDSVLDILEQTASAPMQVKVGDDVLAAVGNSGEHGHGFFMFPNASVPEQARQLAYPMFSCSTN